METYCQLIIEHSFLKNYGERMSTYITFSLATSSITYFRSTCLSGFGWLNNHALLLAKQVFQNSFIDALSHYIKPFCEKRKKQTRF